MKKNNLLLSTLILLAVLLSCRDEESQYRSEIKKITPDQKAGRDGLEKVLLDASFKVIELNIVSGDSLSPNQSSIIPTDIQTICSVDESTCEHPIITMASLGKLGNIDRYELFKVDIPPAGDLKKMGNVFKNQIDSYLQTSTLPDTILNKSSKSATYRSINEVSIPKTNDTIIFFSNLSNSPEFLEINLKKYKVYKDSESLRRYISKLSCEVTSVLKITLFYNAKIIVNNPRKIDTKIDTKIDSIKINKSYSPAKIIPKPIEYSLSGAGESDGNKLIKPRKKGDPWVMAQLGECQNGFREVTWTNIINGKSKTSRERYVECDNVTPEWVNKSLDDVKKGQIKQKEL
jgi:hypothetical protein